MKTQTFFWQTTKYALTALLLIIIPTYWHYYGVQNFLWLSDLGLFATVLALWLNSSLIMSCVALGILFVELIWCVDFFCDLLLNINLITLSDYMFNNILPLGLRAISLFHIVTPIIWLLYLKQYGYWERAIYYVITLYWIVLPLTYFLTDPAENINWVFMTRIDPNLPISELSWLILLAVAFPVLVFLPTHFIFKRLFRPAT